MPTPPNLSRPIGRYRTLFISDVHLGTPDCQAQMLIESGTIVEA